MSGRPESRCFSTLQIGSLIEAMTRAMMRGMVLCFSTLQIGSLIEAQLLDLVACPAFKFQYPSNRVVDRSAAGAGYEGVAQGVSVPFKSGR